MGQRIGERRHNEILLRCTVCGDSDNPRKGHLYVNVQKGTYYCVRCGNGGKLSVGQQLNLIAEHGYTDELGSLPPEDPGLFEPISDWAGSYEETNEAAPLRPTELPRTLVNRDGQWWEWFNMFDRHGDLCGYHVRLSGAKHFYTVGETGISWPGADQGVPLLSSSTDPLYVVEGPYDVLEPRSICVFGTISRSRLKHIGYGHCVILVPDGDIWRKRPLLDAFVATLSDPWAKVEIKGIIKLDGDPDEIGVSLTSLQTLEATYVIAAYNRKYKR